MRWTVQQIPGQAYTFKVKKSGKEYTGILPAAFGESNDFATWSKDLDTARGGWWRSKEKARDTNRGRYASGGLLLRMKVALCARRRSAVLGCYKPPDTTPERMVQEWTSQRGKCAACGGGINLQVRGRSCAHYDHNHETGEPRGFIHRHCNFSEGFFTCLSDDEFKTYIRWIVKNQKRDILCLSLE